MEYRWKQTGPEVEELQEALIAKGYSLPKYGADGELGGETWTRVEAFAEVDQFPTSQPLPVAVTDAILSAGLSPDSILPPGHIKVDGDPNDVHGMRKWSDIDTIVIHQTGVWMSDEPERFRTMNAHVGILAHHDTPIVQTQDLRAYMYHANEANRFSLGIEINGCFPGLLSEFNPEEHSGEGPTGSQIINTREAVKWLMLEAERNGGEIRHIIPHRVSNDTRRSDPGEVAWKTIGIWAQSELGLTDRGPGWTIGDGTPIPGEWDSRAAYRKYKY